MKQALLLLIRFYWRIVPAGERRPCIFRTSCSLHVFQVTQAEGWLNGIRAFSFRLRNCRAGFEIFHHPVNDSKQMILPNGQLIGAEDIAERFLEN
ncbi:membrane protein insertion efficiency factor YidD [Mucilaginibacter calamicampi]|uniref:Membrane protein insertion efficiency factor YidD n=1 Tax=Mucilaginibacter calamicampi TaxID=1302352 RepID=A0ABW2YS92_9SPHI